MTAIECAEFTGMLFCCDRCGLSRSSHPQSERARVDEQYDAGHADGFAEGRREADVTGHLLRPHARHLLDEVLEGWSSCKACAEVRAVLEGLL